MGYTFGLVVDWQIHAFFVHAVRIVLSQFAMLHRMCYVSDILILIIGRFLLFFSPYSRDSLVIRFMDMWCSAKLSYLNGIEWFRVQIWNQLYWHTQKSWLSSVVHASSVLVLYNRTQPFLSISLSIAGNGFRIARLKQKRLKIFRQMNQGIGTRVL